MKKIFQSPVFLPLIFIAAIAFVVFQVKSKAPVEHKKKGYPVKAVEVITLKKIPFRARATAYGHVEPSIFLKVKSEVSGKITYIHPDLKKGAGIKKDTVVLRIEPTTYEITLNQSKAGLAGSQSSLAQLKTEEKSTQSALKIAQNNLNLELKELSRVKSLWAKRIIARSTLDQEQQKVLSLRQQVQDIQGKLSSYASRKAATRAQIKQSKSQVNKSQDTLGRTEIRMPFDARIGTVFVEKGGFTSAGGAQGGGELFEASGLRSVEINAQLPIKQFRPMVLGLHGQNGKTAINLKNPASLQAALSNMKLEAHVRLVGDTDHSTAWDGKLIRISESVDPTRDTLGLVVVVDNPYEGIIPGKRPPLLKGMYTSVEFFSPARATLVLPRKAVHQGRVYVATDKNTLAIRHINILFKQGDLVVMSDDDQSKPASKSEIKEGDKIIVSDVIPVMQGMPLKVIPADEYEKHLALLALGEPTNDDRATETEK